MCSDDVAPADQQGRDEESRRQEFMQAWAHYAESKRKTHEQLDSYLLKLSAGALVLSLSPTARLFSDNATLGPRCLLVLAWLCFIVTIGATLLSLRASAKAEDAMIDIAYATIIEEEDPKETRQDAARHGVQAFNEVAIGGFILGLVFGLVYVGVVFL